MTKTLKLSEIVTDKLQARTSTDDATIQEYAESMKDGGKFPPVIVFHDGVHYYMADGFHRMIACQRNGDKEIAAEVRTGSRKDALWFAIGANKSHGLKRSNADKRKAVALALSEQPDLSDRAIAQHCGVSYYLVAEIRRQVPEMAPESTQVVANQGSDFSEPPKRTGIDGKQYPVKKTDYGPPPTAKKKPKKSEPEPIYDKIGRIIPACCLPVWNRRDEIKSHLDAISSMRGFLRGAEESKDVLFQGFQFSDALADLGNVYSKLKAAIPFTVCPACQGHLAKQCKLCKGKTMIGEWYWDNVVSKDIKDIILKNLPK